MKKPEVKINPFDHNLRIGQTYWRIERLPNAIRDEIEAEDDEGLPCLGTASNAWDAKVELAQGLTGMNAFESVIRFGLHAINETNGSFLTQQGVEDLDISWRCSSRITIGFSTMVSKVSMKNTSHITTRKIRRKNAKHLADPKTQ